VQKHNMSRLNLYAVQQKLIIILTFISLVVNVCLRYLITKRKNEILAELLEVSAIKIFYVYR